MLATPINQLFRPLDAKSMAKKLRLDERGKKNGRDEIPTADQDVLDDVEQEVHGQVNTIQYESADAVRGMVRALRDEVGRLSVSGQLVTLRLKARDAIARFGAAGARISSELQELKDDLQQHEREYNQFREDHRLKRPARKGSSSALTYGLLILFIAIESILNGTFFAKGSELGLVGGVVIAIGISVINVVGAYVAGIFFARRINHRNWGHKLFGATGVVIILVGITAMHFIAAHYRDAVIAVGEAQAFPAAIAHVRASPFMLAELHSYYMAGLGLFLAIASFTKGISSKDPYPGYCEVFSRARTAAQDYADAYSELFADLEDIKNEQVRAFEAALSNIPQEAKQVEQARAQRAHLVVTLARYEDHLEDTGNALLTIYRQANMAARKTPPPSRFREAFRLRRTDLSAFDHQIGDGAPDRSEDVQKALDEISTLMKSVLDEYSSLQNKADRPDAVLAGLRS
jgi:hypothetical protein